jgi:hypothetical protein
MTAAEAPFAERRSAAKLMPANPKISIAQVEGSGVPPVTLL